MRVAVPGTCGELVQGTLDGIPCLVSCPISSYSVVEVHYGLGSNWRLQPHLAKSATALRYGLEYLELTGSSGRVHLNSNLPHGRGYGSSTADIGATLFALGHAVGHALKPAEVAHLALRVEPTDRSLFPGWVLWDHRGGQICKDLGAPPLLSVIVMAPGGKVDTVAYNRQAHAAHPGDIGLATSRCLCALTRRYQARRCRRHWCCGHVKCGSASRYLAESAPRGGLAFGAGYWGGRGLPRPQRDDCGSLN